MTREGKGRQMGAGGPTITEDDDNDRSEGAA